MNDVRRAYRLWLLRRLSWLLPGLVAALTVFLRLATVATLEWWLRLPALAISGGVALLFIGLLIVPFLVLHASRRGDRRRAQSLRREFQSYPALALMSLSLALILLAVPLLFGPAERPAAPDWRGLAGPRVHRQEPPARPEPLPSGVERETIALPTQEPALVTTTPSAAPEPPAPPRAAVAIESAPEPERNPIPPPLPPAPVAAWTTSGEEQTGFRFRTELEGDDFMASAGSARRMLNRAGLPVGDDPEDWPTPELQIDLTIIPDTRGWYGAIYGTLIDVPVLKDTSIRSSYFIASLNDEPGGDVEVEASIAWHRATVEVEQRLAGFRRNATFDLAVRAGLSVDRLDTHEANISVSSVARPAPLLGVEIAVWEEDGVGLVLQASHSFALRINDVASAVTEVRLEVRIDLSEKISLQVGWRYLALRIHDLGSANGVPYEELERTASGPVAGLAVRF